MSALADHKWGKSLAVDRVWAQVSGLRASLARGRLLMVLQAYIDDSYDQGGTFVLGGHIASAAAWAEFSAEWEKMLPYGVRDKTNEFHFKMSEMAALPERMARVAAFYRIIEHHVLASISVRVHQEELRRAKQRIVADGTIHWGVLDSPYVMAWVVLMNNFHLRNPGLGDIIADDQKVDFIFDDQSEKTIILNAWESYVSGNTEDVRERFGATPRFEDDKDFLPLQAADFWAWWVREWYSDGKLQGGFWGLDFGGFKTTKSSFTRIAYSLDEDAAVRFLLKVARRIAPPHATIFDGLGAVD